MVGEHKIIIINMEIKNNRLSNAWSNTVLYIFFFVITFFSFFGNLKETMATRSRENSGSTVAVSGIEFVCHSSIRRSFHVPTALSWKHTHTKFVTGRFIHEKCFFDKSEKCT